MPGPLLRGCHEQGRQVEGVGAPVARLPLAQHVDAPDRLVEAAHPQRGERPAHLLGDEDHVGGDALGRAGELGPEVRPLRRDAGGAGVAVAGAHHDAALGEHGRGSERVLVGAKERGHDDVAAGLEPAVDADAHAVS